MGAGLELRKPSASPDRYEGEPAAANMVYSIFQYQIARLGLVLALLTAGPSLAFAQAEPASSWGTDATSAVDVNAKAKQLMGEGNALYAKRDFEGAHKKFLEAWAIKQHVAIASNLVETEMKLGRFREAATRLRSLLASMPMEDKEERTAFITQLSECRHHLVSLHITISENGATVKVDGKEVGTSPLNNEVLVEPGQSTVTAELAGYRRAMESTSASAAGESKSINLTLVKADTPPIAAAPVLVSTTDRANPESQRNGIQTRTVVLIAGTTLAAAGLGLGVVYWRMRDDTSQEADDLRVEVAPSGGCSPSQPVNATSCAALREAASTYDRQSRLMTGMFIGGGVAAAATVATYLIWPSRHSNSRDPGHATASVVPWSSPGSAGLNFIGQF